MNAAVLPDLLGQAEVYAELKQLARRQLWRQPAGATLNTTALVHEACLKLAAPGSQSPRERSHWLNLAALAMRQVICDHARRRLHRQQFVTPLDDQALAAVPEPDTAIAEARRLLAIDALLTELAKTAPRRAYVLSARFFAGLSENETAAAAGLSLRTVQREWQLARAWLRARLTTC